MSHPYQDILNSMEASIAILARRVPPPKKVEILDSFVFRYVEQLPEQAIIQKLVRVASGLNASRILLEYGFVQELGALQRMLDEFCEDVLFLSYAVMNNDLTDLHRSFLAAFYMEEFDDPSSPRRSTQKRPTIPRQKIQAYLARVEGQLHDPSTSQELARTITKAYSGYVHGASPHIMETYGGNPPRFHVSGMAGTTRALEHAEDIWSYFYRGSIAFGMGAKATLI